MEELTDEIRKTLREQHPGEPLHELEVTSGDDTIAIVVKESAADFTAWVAKRTADESSAEDKRRMDIYFVSAVLVWPTKDGWLSIAKLKPAIAGSFCNEMSKLYGAAREVRRKKL